MRWSRKVRIRPARASARQREGDRARGVAVQAVHALGEAAARLAAAARTPGRATSAVSSSCSPGADGTVSRPAGLSTTITCSSSYRTGSEQRATRQRGAVRVEVRSAASSGDLAPRLAHAHAADRDLALLDHLPRLAARELRVAAGSAAGRGASGYSSSPRASSHAAGSCAEVRAQDLIDARGAGA